MKVFSLLVDKAVVGGFLTGYTLKGSNGASMNVSHLLFVDDTLIFCRDLIDQIANLSWILLWFEALFGLQVNLEKSVIFPVGVVENIVQLVEELGCRVGALPSTYLGLPLGLRQNSSGAWEGIKDSSEEDFQFGRDGISQKGGGSRLSIAPFPTYLLTYCPCLGCPRA